MAHVLQLVTAYLE